MEAPPKQEGRKDDDNKARYDLVVWPFVEEVAMVLSHGAIKYSDYNWTQVKGHRNRYFSAAQRHLVAWYEGETHDQETGYHHLAYAACCLMFLWWFDRNDG